MPSRNRQNLRSRHIRDEPQRRRHSPIPRLHNLHPQHKTRRTPNRKNHQLRLSQRRRTKNPTVTRQSWPRVCGSAHEWRTIRAFPSEPALAHKKTEQFFKPYGREIHFQRSQSAKQKNRRSGTKPKHDYFLCFAGNATCRFCFRFKSFSR